MLFWSLLFLLGHFSQLWVTLDLSVPQKEFSTKLREMRNFFPSNYWFPLFCATKNHKNHEWWFFLDNDSFGSWPFEGLGSCIFIGQKCLWIGLIFVIWRVLSWNVWIGTFDSHQLVVKGCSWAIWAILHRIWEHFLSVYHKQILNNQKLVCSCIFTHLWIFSANSFFWPLWALPHIGPF